MIIGVGIDLCSNERIKKVHKKFSRFAKRILTTYEYNEFANQLNKTQFLAKTWAIKEAVAKSTTLGLSQMGFQNVWLEYSNEIPKLCINQQLAELLAKKFDIKDHNFYLSITYEQNLTCAMVIFERKDT